MRHTILLLRVLASFTLLIMMFGCEEQINPKLQTAQPVLVVDAWLNDQPGPQSIVLTMTQPYFENVLPPGVAGATVIVTDSNGDTFTFVEEDPAAGKYTWTPVASEVLAVVGRKYTLEIVANGETFTAETKVGRVPAIDSITFEKDKRIGAEDSITRAEFWATDPIGIGDAYWIRSYKNSVLLNKPSEINIAYDAGFSSGGPTDGVTFITPIRRRINPNDKDANDRTLNPFVPGDSINVQIHSISKEAFNYLNEVAIQTDRPGGFQELFSTPLANVPTNIVNTVPGGSPVVGFFNVSAVSTAGKKYLD